MPIYAYKCESCGFAKDVLQKISDAPLHDCPACKAPVFKKQVTAAGFQLKGSGWYVTDFKGGSTPTTSPANAANTTSSDVVAGANAASPDAGTPSKADVAASPSSPSGSSAPASTTSS